MMAGMIAKDAVNMREAFKGVRLSDVTVEDLADARTQAPRHGPDGSLAKLAFDANLGEVTAFVSHTWHDDHEQRYDALQRWAKPRKSKDQDPGELIVWIDKACLDWGEKIEDSIRCLPIYLRVRYWSYSPDPSIRRDGCCVEVFAFLSIGARPSMSIWPLASWLHLEARGRASTLRSLH